MKNAAPGAKYRKVAVEEMCGQYLVGWMRAKRESSGQDRQCVRVESVTCAALETRNTTAHVIV
jgi:hypothetical protein